MALGRAGKRNASSGGRSAGCEHRWYIASRSTSPLRAAPLLTTYVPATLPSQGQEINKFNRIASSTLFRQYSARSLLPISCAMSARRRHGVSSVFFVRWACSAAHATVTA